MSRWINSHARVCINMLIFLLTVSFGFSRSLVQDMMEAVDMWQTSPVLYCYIILVCWGYEVCLFHMLVSLINNFLYLQWRKTNYTRRYTVVWFCFLFFFLKQNRASRINLWFCKQVVYCSAFGLVGYGRNLDFVFFPWSSYSSLNSIITQNASKSVALNWPLFNS